MRYYLVLRMQTSFLFRYIVLGDIISSSRLLYYGTEEVILSCISICAPIFDVTQQQTNQSKMSPNLAVFYPGRALPQHAYHLAIIYTTTSTHMNRIKREREQEEEEEEEEDILSIHGGIVEEVAGGAGACRAHVHGHRGGRAPGSGEAARPHAGAPPPGEEARGAQARRPWRPHQASPPHVTGCRRAHACSNQQCHLAFILFHSSSCCFD